MYVYIYMYIYIYCSNDVADVLPESVDTCHSINIGGGPNMMWWRAQHDVAAGTKPTHLRGD